MQLKAKVLGFTKSKQNPNYDVVIVAGEIKKDDFLGLEVDTGKKYFVCAKHYSYKKIVGKEATLELAHSPTLNQDVCTNILLDVEEKKSTEAVQDEEVNL